MARPASRYFVPVIRKISEMKKAENIRIDQQFKADLRGELMLRVGLGEAGARKEAYTADEARGLSGDGRIGGLGLAGFLNKWKYQMALVPVALVLMLVAVQSFKMPVKMASETAVPVAGTTEMEEVKTMRTAEGMVDTDSSATAASQESGTWGDELSMTPAELKEGGPVEVSGQKGVSRSAQTTQPVDEPARTGGGQVETVEPAVKAVPVLQTASVNIPVNIPYNSPATDYAPVSDKKPGVAAGDLPPELMDQVVETEEVSGTQTRAVEQVDVSFTEETAVQDLPAVYEPTLVVAPAVIEPLVNVQYDQSFVEDKESLEKGLLADLMRDGGYDYAAVSQADDGVVTVELSGVDGSASKKTYKWNTRTLAWDEVVYVQNYYFDDNLQYERSDLSSPLFVPSGDRFYDTQYYRYGY